MIRNEKRLEKMKDTNFLSLSTMLVVQNLSPTLNQEMNNKKLIVVADFFLGIFRHILSKV